MFVSLSFTENKSKIKRLIVRPKLCENEEYMLWVPIRVSYVWKGGEGMFKCGLCVMKDVVEVRN